MGGKRTYDGFILNAFIVLDMWRVTTSEKKIKKNYFQKNKFKFFFQDSLPTHLLPNVYFRNKYSIFHFFLRGFCHVFLMFNTFNSKRDVVKLDARCKMREMDKMAANSWKNKNIAVLWN